VTRYCFTAAGAEACHLRVASEVRYPRGAPWAVTTSLIERSAYGSLREYFTSLADALRAHVVAHPPAVGGPETARPDPIVESSAAESAAGASSTSKMGEVVAAVEAEAAEVVAAAQAELAGPTWRTLMAVTMFFLLLGFFLSRSLASSPPLDVPSASALSWCVLLLLGGGSTSAPSV
jgi:hypothetical protein